MEDQIKELQVRLSIALSQRNEALDNVVVVAAKLNMAIEKIKTLEEPKDTQEA